MSKMPVKQGKSKIKKLKGKIIFVLCLLLVAAALIAGLVIIKNANDKANGESGTGGTKTELPVVDFSDMFN